MAMLTIPVWMDVMLLNVRLAGIIEYIVKLQNRLGDKLLGRSLPKYLESPTLSAANYWFLFLKLKRNLWEVLGSGSGSVARGRWHL